MGAIGNKGACCLLLGKLRLLHLVPSRRQLPREGWRWGVLVLLPPRGVAAHLLEGLSGEGGAVTWLQ